jgi:phosphoribosyl 1,2-cyclic phosphodiesterase
LLRFCSLASGSGGNATLIEARSSADGPTTRVLVDCGLTLRRLTASLARRGCTPGDIDALFVTHEHSDHATGAIALQRRHGTPVWMSRGTRDACIDGDDAAPAPVQIACDGVPIRVGPLTLLPFAVPHDAAEPLQLVCSTGQARVGLITDLGEPDDGVVAALQGCDALLLECNHDRALLQHGPYPAWLKRRIGGARGHLENDQAAALLAAVRHSALRYVLAAHLSRQNNAPALALAALARAVPAAGRAPALQVADPDHGSAWFEAA